MRFDESQGTRNPYWVLVSLPDVSGIKPLGQRRSELTPPNDEGSGPIWDRTLGDNQPDKRRTNAFYSSPPAAARASSASSTASTGVSTSMSRCL